MELLVIFVIIFIIYGAGWIWQTINDILRDANRVQWDAQSGLAAPAHGGRRRLLGGHDLGALALSFQRFADLRSGEFHGRQGFESPKVSFTHHGARALLSIYESSDGGGSVHTQLTYTVPEGWTYRLEVFPQRFADADGRYLNVNDIRIGDEEFDPRFVVKSNDDAFAREFLDGAARQAVEDLRNLLRNDRILISVNSSRLMVRKESVIAGSDDLMVFADLAGRLHDRIELFWQRASGIEILEEPAVRPPSGDRPVCQICGFQIGELECVSCKRCRTPHHKECWEWNGHCSTYACGETRFSTKN